MIRLAVRVPREHAETALAELLELAPAGVEEVALEDGRVEYAVYGPPGELPALPELHALAGATPVEIATTEIADDWQERWREFHRPVLVEAPAGTGVPPLRIRPPWEPAAAAGEGERIAGGGAPAIELVIDPGQAFGTGAHASTRLCLGLLQELRAQLAPPAAVLDVGAGSGVLAIAAAKLGYAPLLAIDNETESVLAAAENAAVNGVQVEARRSDLRREPLPWLGPAERSPGGPVIVLANLLEPLLLALARSLSRAPDALIAGGLLVEQLDSTAAAFAPLGMRERGRRCAEGWGALWLAAD